MSKLKNIFQRKESKYPLSFAQYQQLRRALTPYLVEDEYGLHTIISVYYDTEDFQLIQRSIQKPEYREKFRLRSYGIPSDDSPVFLEIKKKVQKIVYKRRIGASYQEALQYNYHNCNLPVFGAQNRQIKQEIDWLFQRKQLQPQVMIAYDRIAMKALDDELTEFRITFDFDIRYRNQDLDLRHGDYGQRVAPEMDVLMEVKALGTYPLWFAKILAELKIQKSSFSKYAQTYQRYLLGQNTNKLTLITNQNPVSEAISNVI